MITDNDRTVLESVGVTNLDPSDWHPWPALDFTAGTEKFTVLYGLDTDVFVVRRHSDDSLWTFKYRSTVSPMKARVFVVLGDEEIPLPVSALRWLGAMIMNDVRKIKPTAKAFTAGMN